MKTQTAFLSVLVVVLSLSACGRKSMRPEVTGQKNQQTQTDGEQAAFKEKAVKEMAEAAKCQNDIPVDQAPEGFKEVKLSELKGEKNGAFLLVHVRTNGAVLAADGHVVSGSTSTTVDYDEKLLPKEPVSKIDCKEVMGGDKLELAASPVLAMDASNGTYAQRLGVSFLLEPSDDSKKEQYYDDANVTDTFFNQMKTYEKDRALAKEQGGDLIVKAYKDKDGNLEIRTTRLKRTKLYSQKMLLNTAISYRAVAIQNGGAK